MYKIKAILFTSDNYFTTIGCKMQIKTLLITAVIATVVLKYSLNYMGMKKAKVNNAVHVLEKKK